MNLYIVYGFIVHINDVKESCWKYIVLSNLTGWCMVQCTPYTCTPTLRWAIAHGYHFYPRKFARFTESYFLFC